MELFGSNWTENIAKREKKSFRGEQIREKKIFFVREQKIKNEKREAKHESVNQSKEVELGQVKELAALVEEMITKSPKILNKNELHYT